MFCQKSHLKLHLGLVVALVALMLDQISKWWIIKILELPKIYLVPLMPHFNLQWAENRGVSFSMFTADGELGRWALVIITGLIAIGLGIWLKTVQTRTMAMAIGLVIGGAIGNVIDRVRFGYVADFIQFYVGDWSFAIFNVADSCISIGAALLIWDSFFGAESKKTNSEKKFSDKG